MKKLLLTIAVAALFMFGCQDANNPIAPNTNTVQYEQTSQPNWIILPKGENSTVEGYYSVHKKINGKKGGEIRLKTEYHGGVHGIVKIDAIIKFPKHFIVGTKDISLLLDSENGLTTFYPHMKFKKSAEYNLKIEGLDLSNINTDNIKFVYQNSNGNIEQVKYDKIKIDKSKGYIEVQKAKLNHFSRYGFVN